MELDYLVDCTVKFLKLLIEQYKCKKINYESFRSNSDLKVRFLKDNIDKIELPIQRKEVESVLEIWEEISTKH